MFSNTGGKCGNCWTYILKKHSRLIRQQQLRCLKEANRLKEEDEGVKMLEEQM